jgi:hypothetical protein
LFFSGDQGVAGLACDGSMPWLARYAARSSCAKRHEGELKTELRRQPLQDADSGTSRATTRTNADALARRLGGSAARRRRKTKTRGVRGSAFAVR